MKLFYGHVSTLVLVVLTAHCAAAGPDRGSSDGGTGDPCGSDNDCKGDRICLDNGKCSKPGGGTTGSGSGTSGPVGEWVCYDKNGKAQQVNFCAGGEYFSSGDNCNECHGLWTNNGDSITFSTVAAPNCKGGSITLAYSGDTITLLDDDGSGNVFCTFTQGDGPCPNPC